MQSIIRFLLVMSLVFGTVLLWKTDRSATAAVPPKMSSKGNDPQEEVEKSLRPLRLAPAQKDWSKSAFQERLADALDRNDPCSVLVLTRDKSPVSPEERWASGMEILLQRQRQKRPALMELFATPNSPLYGKPNEASSLKETRFFNALLFANQLEGYDENSESPHSNPHRSSEKAVALLKELAQEDPENGAYGFFLAQALRQMGTGSDDVRAALSQASRASAFETFYQGLYDDLLAVSFENLASFTWVYSYLHGAPEPNFQPTIGYLRYWASQEEPGKWAANRLAKKLVDIGTKFKATSPGYLYSQAEYMIGINLRYTLEGRAEKDWKDYANRMKEARDFISETPGSVGMAETDLYMDYFSGKNEDCRWASWQALYEAYQAKKP